MQEKGYDHLYTFFPVLLILMLLLLAGCSGRVPVGIIPSLTPKPTGTETSTPLPSLTVTFTPEPTPTGTATATQTSTLSDTPVPTETPIPSETPVPTETLTPTIVYPAVTAKLRAFCRYGPGQAYLYSHELRAGDPAEVHGRNYSGSWLWIKPENLDRHCWAAASVLEISGDVMAVPAVTARLPQSILYGPPEEVEAYREGDSVTVVWSPVWMTEDDYRGYLIEAAVCENGQRISVAVHSDETSYTFIDEQSCSGSSGGKLYTVEKHGYTTPVEISWP